MSSSARSISTLQAQAQQLSQDFRAEIEDFRSIARLHDLPVGQPPSLAALPLRLSQDSRLRSDFAELIRALQAGNLDFSLADALTVLTLAVGGAAALGRNPSLDEPKSLLGGFLATLGRWPGADDQPITDLDNPPDHDPRIDLQIEARRQAAADGDAARAAAAATIDLPFLPEDAPSPAWTQSQAKGQPPYPPADAGEASSSTPISPDAGTLSRLSEVLARLERGNLELRLHLDSIDQRISRMEPLLEGVPHGFDVPASDDPAERSTPAAPPVPPAPPARSAPQDLPLVHRDTHAPSVSPVPQTPSRAQLAPNPATRTAEPLPPAAPRDRIALEPLRVAPPSPAIAPPPGVATAAPSPSSAGQPAAAPETSPDRSSAQTPRPRRERFAAARNLPGFQQEVLGASGRDLPDDVAPELAVASAPVQKPAQDPAAAAPQLRPTATVPLFAAATSSRSLADSDSTDDSAPKSRKGLLIAVLALILVAIASFFFVFGSPLSLLQRNQPSPSQSHDVGRSPQPAPSEQSPAPADSAKPEVSPKTPANGRVLGAREALAPSESSETPVPQTTASPTFVPEAVMDGYLLSAPHPVYPRLANIVGVSGRIVFEAMISKEGTIESVHALGGNRLLRDAAANAVRQWEYRPFLIRGQPVEVRTIIRVDVTPEDSE